MTFKDFTKSVWFPVLVFIIIELLFIIYGFFQYPMCKPGAYCPPMIVEYMILGIIPSIILSIIAHFVAKRFIN